MVRATVTLKVKAAKAAKMAKARKNALHAKRSAPSAGRDAQLARHAARHAATLGVLSRKIGARRRLRYYYHRTNARASSR